VGVSGVGGGGGIQGVKGGGGMLGMMEIGFIHMLRWDFRTATLH